MRSAKYWLDAYAADHQNPTNKALHHICVPLIVLSLIGLLWSLPTPAAFTSGPEYLNWGTLCIAAAMAYYAVLSIRLALGLLPFVLACEGAVIWMDTLTTPLWLISLVIFVVAWIGQFVGHLCEGKRPSFFRDLQFLMIGPLWLLSGLYDRLGVRYS